METIIAGIVGGIGVTAAWLDLRKRTNGNGPISCQIKELRGEVRENTHRTVRVEERLARVEERIGYCPVNATRMELNQRNVESS